MLLALPSIGVISQRLGTDAVIGVAIAVAIALDLSINVSFNPARSMITDVTPEGAERTRGYTWMQTVSGSFGVLAYAIGAVFGNFALIYVGAVHRAAVLGAAGIRWSTEPAYCPARQQRKRLRVASAGDGIGNVMALIEPLWAFLVYDIVAMGLRLAGVSRRQATAWRSRSSRWRSYCIWRHADGKILGAQARRSRIYAISARCWQRTR